MLTLWVVFEYLRTCIQCIVKHWRGQREQLHCRRKSIHAIDKRKHHYSQHKPEWLKHEILRLKARMPQAGCRTIADICNRRFAAARKVTLDGGAGADTLIGNRGNDHYIVDNSGDVVVENLNEGVGRVSSSVSYTLGANIEGLGLTGTANINGSGNELDNIIAGNSGDNILAGGAGADVLDVMFGRNKCQAANDAEERMAA